MAANVEGAGERSGLAAGQTSVVGTRAQHPSSLAPSAETGSLNLARRRILVVDDNIDAARSLAKVLTLIHEQNVQVAHDGPSALEVAETFRPQIVLLDIGLPGMNGYEVAERLRSHAWFEGCMLVAVTGWGQKKDRAASRVAGFDHHLVKPVHQATIQDLLDGKLRSEE